MRLKQLIISKYFAEGDIINRHLRASPLFGSRSGSTPRAPGALPGHDGGAIWPAARIRAPGHRPSAFPKDTPEAPFGAKWSTIALGAFPAAFGRWYWVLAFFRERRTIAARICSFANAGLGTSAIAALRSEGNAALCPAQSRCDTVLAPGSALAATISMTLRLFPVLAGISAHDFPRAAHRHRRIAFGLQRCDR